jgi:hypothetical protein
VNLNRPQFEQLASNYRLVDVKSILSPQDLIGLLIPTIDCIHPKLIFPACRQGLNRSVTIHKLAQLFDLDVASPLQFMQYYTYEDVFRYIELELLDTSHHIVICVNPVLADEVHALHQVLLAAQYALNKSRITILLGDEGQFVQMAKRIAPELLAKYKPITEVAYVEAEA